MVDAQEHVTGMDLSTCDGHGLVVGFGNSTYECDSYSPLIDTGELMDLAHDMDTDARDWDAMIDDAPMVCASRLLDYAKRTRDICGGDVN